MAVEATKRLRLGQELKAARKGAGITQQRAAAALGCTQSKINKIETTTCVVTREDLDALLRFYAAPEERRQRILLLAARSRPGPSAGTRANGDYLKLLELERRASEVLVLHAERIPNLLQSEHYMLMQHQVAGQLSPDLATIMQGLREREQLFTIPRPPHYRAVLSVSALHRMPGGRTARLVIDQAQHLLTLSERYPAHLSIQVVPWEAKLPYFPHDLTVLRFADSAEDKDQVYQEYGIGESRMYSGKRQVATHVRYWTMAHDAALSVDETRKHLHGLINEARSW